MTGKVIEGCFITSLDVPAEKVLQAALDRPLNAAIVIGLDENDDFYFASSIGNGADVLWWIKVAEKKLLEMGDV